VVRVAHLMAARLAAGRADQQGQGMAEYALMLAFVAIVAIAALTMLGAQVTATLSWIGANIAGTQP
jgi:Flp pilus assembly pilin Flp